MSGALVAKLGGNALALLPDALAAADGRPLVLVHGGGAQITALMERRGIPARFVQGFAPGEPAAVTVSDSGAGE